MFAKTYRGKPYGADLTAKERKAMVAEINRQIAESDKQHRVDTLSAILYAMHIHLGFGKRRLRKFYEALGPIYDELIARYELSEDDGDWLCRYKLKAIGVDVEEWDNETR